MGDTRNFAALDWVTQEIDETLAHAREALESWANDPNDNSKIRFCLAHIHQVHGSLQMVEFYGAALLAEELEHLAKALCDEKVQFVVEAQEALMRGILQLPVYLDRIKTQRRDQPAVLLPLLNDLRSVRGDNLLSESRLFNPDLRPAQRINGARIEANSNQSQFLSLEKKLQQMYQYAAAAIVRGVKVRDNILYLHKVIARQYKLTSGTPNQALWEVSLALIEALAEQGLELSAAIKLLLRQLNREMKVLIHKGVVALDSPCDQELLRNLLFYVAISGSNGRFVSRIREKYNLTANLLGDSNENEISLGHDPEAIRSVVLALKEELRSIKLNLDDCLSSDSTMDCLQDSLPVAQRVADTLAILGVGDIRKQMLAQVEALESIIKTGEYTDQQLFDIASDLIDIEGRLDALTRGVAMARNDLEQQKALQLNIAQEVVLAESRNGLEQTKDCIIEYIASQWDRRHLINVPKLLREIRGGLDMVPLTRAGAVLGACAQYIDEQLLQDGLVPEWRSLDTLADAIASIEYYLEHLSGKDNHSNDEMLLAVAEDSVRNLGLNIDAMTVAAKSFNPPEDAFAPKPAALASSFDEPVVEVEEPQPESHSPAAAADQFAAAAETDFSDNETIIRAAPILPLDEIADSNPWQEPVVEMDAEPAASGSDDAEASWQSTAADWQSTATAMSEELAQGEPVATDSDTEFAPEPEMESEAEAEAEAEANVEAEANYESDEADVEADVEAETTAEAESVDDLIDDEILEIFIEEAQEVSETIDEFYPRWVANLEDREALTEFRRAFHTLKGSGRMVGATDIGELAWTIENMLNRVLDKTVEPHKCQVELINRTLQLLPTLIGAFEKRQANPEKALCQQYMAWAEEIAAGGQPDALLTSAPAPASPEPVDIDADAESLVDDSDIPLADDVVLTEAVELSEEALATAADDVVAETSDDEDDDSQAVLWEIFSAEANGHLAIINEFISEMDRARPLYATPSDPMQRALHTLKGSAHMADVQPIARLATPLEHLVKELRTYQIVLDEDLLQLIKDGVEYITLVLDQIADQEELVIPKLDQYVARITELRERTIVPILRQQDAEEGKSKPVDPELLSIFMAEEMNLLLDADLLIDKWQQTEPDTLEMNAVLNEVQTLKTGATHANHPAMAQLSSLLEQVYHSAIAGELPLNNRLFELLRRGHDALLDMVDAVAAGQNLPSLSLQLRADIELLLDSREPVAVPEEDYTASGLLASELLDSPEDYASATTETALAAGDDFDPTYDYNSYEEAVIAAAGLNASESASESAALSEPDFEASSDELTGEEIHDQAEAYEQDAQGFDHEAEADDHEIEEDVTSEASAHELTDVEAEALSAEAFDSETVDSETVDSETVGSETPASENPESEIPESEASATEAEDTAPEWLTVDTTAEADSDFAFTPEQEISAATGSSEYVVVVEDHDAAPADEESLSEEDFEAAAEMETTAGDNTDELESVAEFGFAVDDDFAEEVGDNIPVVSDYLDATDLADADLADSDPAESEAISDLDNTDEHLETEAAAEALGFAPLADFGDDLAVEPLAENHSAAFDTTEDAGDEPQTDAEIPTLADSDLAGDDFIDLITDEGDDDLEDQIYVAGHEPASAETSNAAEDVEDEAAADDGAAIDATTGELDEYELPELTDRVELDETLEAQIELEDANAASDSEQATADDETTDVESADSESADPESADFASADINVDMDTEVDAEAEPYAFAASDEFTEDEAEDSLPEALDLEELPPLEESDLIAADYLDDSDLDNLASTDHSAEPESLDELESLNELENLDELETAEALESSEALAHLDDLVAHEEVLESDLEESLEQRLEDSLEERPEETFEEYSHSGNLDELIDDEVFVADEEFIADEQLSADEAMVSDEVMVSDEAMVSDDLPDLDDDELPELEDLEVPADAPDHRYQPAAQFTTEPPSAAADDGSEELPEEIDREIVEIFAEEASEILEEIDIAVHDWANDWANTECLEQLKRSLHTYKGSARLAGIMGLGEVAHDFESFLIHEGHGDLSDKFFGKVNGYYELMYAGTDGIQKYLQHDSAPHLAKLMTAGALTLENNPYVTVTGTAHPTAAATSGSASEPSQPFATTETEDTAYNIDDHGSQPPAADERTDASEPYPPAEVIVTGNDAINTDNVVPFAPRKAIQETPIHPLTPIKRPDRISGPPVQTMMGTHLAQRGAAQESVKVAAELLEELVNLAGETSISRARMEEQMNEVGHTIEEMEFTIERLQEQLRRLDIETEAQVLFRQEQMEQHEEFDPLEMDRYSHLQQLSRSLMESASDLLDLKATLAEKTRDTETLLLQQSRINTELQEGLMRSRMVPFSRLVPRLRRIVRQVSGELGKRVVLELDNVEGELDRTMLERMIAPLEHMVRNAIDHGIEMPSARVALGKDETGIIRLGLAREGGEVILNLSDDGRGIDIERVKSTAVKRGLMAQDAELSDADIMQFILTAGFSTAQAVTQISGRGVGMDVVNSEIKQLGGSVSIDSKAGKGSAFKMRLPFTLSVNRALMVSMGEDIFAVPLNTIEGIVRVSPYELEHYYATPDARFEYAGQQYQVRYLGSLLDESYRPQLDGHALPLPVLLVRSREYSVALQVDSLLGSREIVVKSLGPQFGSVEGLAGATVMGDGSVVVILDLLALVRRLVAQAYMVESQVKQFNEKDITPKEDTVRTVMIVDDSVTVRKVTSRFLEREGYNVITAKDGVDALRQLQDRVPDIMLLDIEMPRMDGFEVAKNIRTSSHLHALPIIMITSRTGSKHRERAYELGVNNYLGKPYQEDELLASIKELTEQAASVV